MPGLSSNPDARARQLAALERGRVTAARNALARAGAEPVHSTSSSTGTVDQLPVLEHGQEHVQPPAPEPVHEDPDEEEPDGEPEPEPGPARAPEQRRRGAVGRFIDGFAGG